MTCEQHPQEALTSNYWPEIQEHLGNHQGESSPAVAIEVMCGICNINKLDISTSTRRSLSDSTSPKIWPSEPPNDVLHLMHTYLSRRVEQTAALPCGHIFGRSCLSNRFVVEASTFHQSPDPDPDHPEPFSSCPSCEYPLVYSDCRHALNPCLIPVPATTTNLELLQNTTFFPLSSGGCSSPAKTSCKECMWDTVSSHLEYILSPNCSLCELQQQQKQQKQQPKSNDSSSFSSSSSPSSTLSEIAPSFSSSSPSSFSSSSSKTSSSDNDNDNDDGEKQLTEHAAHRANHLNTDIRQAMTDLINMVWPAMSMSMSTSPIITTTGTRKADEEVYEFRRQEMSSLLTAIALTELEETIWLGTPHHHHHHHHKKFPRDKLERHREGVELVEMTLLGWMMEPR